MMETPPEPRGKSPHIDVQIHSPLWEARPCADKIVRDAILAAAAALSTADGEVSIVLTDDSAIRSLNRDWRGIDRPTNVLSFPASGRAAGEGIRLFGDIVIAFETIERECVDENRIFLHHLAHLAVHGFLHLLGYDHQTDEQAAEMERLESRIMSRLNIPDPYRAHDLRSV
jgi:probable rRNA maturation factor